MVISFLGLGVGIFLLTLGIYFHPLKACEKDTVTKDTG